MQARTGDALGEMTLVRRHKRAGVSVRTRRDQMRAGFDQLSPRGDDALPAGRRSRLDDDERVGGRAPQTLQDRLPNLRRKFVERVSHRDQIARRAIDSVGRDIRGAPADVRQRSLARELFAASPKNRACLEEQGISKIWPAIGRSPERSAGTGADVERGCRCKIRAGSFDRGEACAYRRIGRGETTAR